MKKFWLKTSQIVYRLAVRPVLFLSDSERVHTLLTSLGESFGKSNAIKSILRNAWATDNSALEQTIHGVSFKNPVGLAAGFDHEARLTQILPAIGFGFSTVGTITSQPYEGNSPPRLGRLIKSRSLMVNKGFKNSGIHSILRKLQGFKFKAPVGLSLGKTNTPKPMTQSEAVHDVVAAFEAAEASPVSFGYYELNISCPNLHGNIEFYAPQHLNELLSVVTGLGLSKPLFIKMPIDKSDEEVKGMLEVIVSHPVQGVIFGNLQKNRHDPAIDPKEAVKYSKGFFSGKPTEKRSNELIALAYKSYGDKLTIIGCGGVFGPEDAYKKIRLGASLVQLITGLVYEGPQLAAQINSGLVKLLNQDNFSHISQAVGADAR